jgi:hypothetical protein
VRSHGAGTPPVNGDQAVTLVVGGDPLMFCLSRICTTTTGVEFKDPDLRSALRSRAVALVEKPFDMDDRLAGVPRADEQMGHEG